MKGETLEIVSHHPYLGVELSDNLKFNDHIDTITKPEDQWSCKRSPDILAK